MPIARAKAHEAVPARIAEPLGISPIEAAWGILRVLATNVMVAMRTITVERGYDPREFTLVPFGGMGPTIAGRIAAELGIGRILIPRDPGAFSAHGMLVTDVHQQRSLTRITPVDGTTARRARRNLRRDGSGRVAGPDARAIPARASADGAARRACAIAASPTK